MSFFFFNDTATTEIYTLSLHDALPIYADLVRAERRDVQRAAVARHRHALRQRQRLRVLGIRGRRAAAGVVDVLVEVARRSEEHTSELQSRQYLVCRLLLEKKKRETNVI